MQLRDAGPGSGPQILAAALAAPHDVVAPASSRYTLPADSTHRRTVIVLGRTTYVEGAVHGDVIVVGGDLYMHPGGRIDGRAIAMGGGVYESMLAHTGGVLAFRDFTYDVNPIAGGYSLSYHELSAPTPAAPMFSLPGIQGLQIPSYDRTNGLSLPVAVLLAPPHTPFEIEPRLTYRSQLGRLDPSVAVGARLDRRTTARLDVGRGTFTNDAWIWSDLVNSGEYLLLGDDARNYYRATRAQAVVTRRWESAESLLEPYAGARIERATSVRPGANPTGGPWALFNRHDHDDVLRFNPPIDPGTIGSFLAGAQWTVTTEGITARARLDEEIGLFSPRAGGDTLGRSGFAQTTFDGSIAFPTFGTQRLRLDAHGVLTGGSAPRQRYAYVGGPGTIPTLDLLERGGDKLVYFDARYDIPVEQVVVPLVGSPVITLREILAGATTSGFPSLAQAMGGRLSAGFAYFELLVDPVNRHVFKGFGISLAR